MGARNDTDAVIGRLAGRQLGVVTYRQLRRAGITRKAIEVRRGRASLIPLHHGVYAVGHTAITPAARRLAAVFACGPKAALSHRSAAVVWGMRPRGGPEIEVTVPASGGRGDLHGVRPYRSRTLRPGDVTTRGPLRLTTPSRTALDLCAVLRREYAEAALGQAEAQGIFDLAALRATIAASPRAPGASLLARILDDAEDVGLPETLSEREVAFRALCHDFGLPQPVANARIAGARRDFSWAAARLVVEIDSWTWHRSRRRFEDDRARDQELVRAGWRTLRFTTRQARDERAAVAATIAAALTSRA